MEALRLSVKYGHGDLGWADRQSKTDLVDLLALEREEAVARAPKAPRRRP